MMRSIAIAVAVTAFQQPPLKLRLRSSRVAAASAAPLDAAALPVAVSPGRLSVKVGGKALNACGVWFVFAMTAWVFALYPLVLSLGLFSFAFDVKRRRAMDWVVSLWARLSMLTCGYRPRVTGELPPRGDAVLFVPNHTSYLDILTLSGFLGRPFKYISKIEILRIPLIGWAMSMAGHVALRRSDRRSQLECFTKAVGSLKDGNSLVAFAEGTRSLDGKLSAFKRGPFKMAIESGVDVVPVALKDLHRWHPPAALMPLARPRNVEIQVLPRISTKDKTAEAVLDECYKAVNDALPDHQKAAPKKI